MNEELVAFDVPSRSLFFRLSPLHVGRGHGVLPNHTLGHSVCPSVSPSTGRPVCEVGHLVIVFSARLFDTLRHFPHRRSPSQEETFGSKSSSALYRRNRFLSSHVRRVLPPLPLLPLSSPFFSWPSTVAICRSISHICKPELPWVDQKV